MKPDFQKELQSNKTSGSALKNSRSQIDCWKKIKRFRSWIISEILKRIVYRSKHQRASKSLFLNPLKNSWKFLRFSFPTYSAPHFHSRQKLIFPFSCFSFFFHYSEEKNLFFHSFICHTAISTFDCQSSWCIFNFWVWRVLCHLHTIFTQKTHDTMQNH